MNYLKSAKKKSLNSLTLKMAIGILVTGCVMLSSLIMYSPLSRRVEVTVYGLGPV